MNKRIFVVDDDSNIRGLIQKRLTQCGYDVFEVGDGAEALSWFDTNQADLAIIDVLLPEMNGVELAYQINHRFPTMPILAISGGNDLISKELCLKLIKKVGVTEAIEKPFDLENLVAKVNDLLLKYSPQSLTTTLAPNSTYPILWSGLII